MYIVRETYIAKPGHAGELARLFKEEMTKMPGFKGYVLLDMVTDYNTIVIEFELDSLANWEKMMMEYKQQREKKGVKSKPAKYTELYLTGKREIFRIV